jgi:hypothetical protein
MITLAAVTMVFLPGTFISAILSTTVFDYGQDELQVSRQWWLLVVTTVPLTAVVFLFWAGWRKRDDCMRLVRQVLMLKPEKEGGMESA